MPQAVVDGLAERAINQAAAIILPEESADLELQPKHRKLEVPRKIGLHAEQQIGDLLKDAGAEVDDDDDREQLEANRESYLLKHILHYRIDGKRRWFAAARQALSCVWQHGRFNDDIEYWRHGLSDSTVVKPVKLGKCLRFFLTTKDDFEFFHQAATEKLLTTEWMTSSPEEELDEVEAEE